MWVSTKIPREKLKELVQKYKEAKVTAKNYKDEYKSTNIVKVQQNAQIKYNIK